MLIAIICVPSDVSTITQAVAKYNEVLLRIYVMQAQEKHSLSEIDSLEIIRLIPERKQGSADIVTEDRMNKGLVINSLNALSGQAAGVNVTSGENRMAQLSSVRVRGTTSLTGGNDPLVIIDGVYSDLSTLSSIYPADIESFTILKNAAETAKYGSRGASGVIQVTTKKGHGSITLEYYSIQELNKLLEAMGVTVN